MNTQRDVFSTGTNEQHLEILHSELAVRKYGIISALVPERREAEGRGYVFDFGQVKSAHQILCGGLCL